MMVSGKRDLASLLVRSGSAGLVPYFSRLLLMIMQPPIAFQPLLAFLLLPNHAPCSYSTGPGLDQCAMFSLQSHWLAVIQVPVSFECVYSRLGCHCGPGWLCLCLVLRADSSLLLSYARQAGTSVFHPTGGLGYCYVSVYLSVSAIY
ncbi:unnamed protein product [Periconia digitata]|uniref:Uncharacterized protein n=1 Tax=Periconia digitata TaxID=1303443 RepID=A0A9W4URF2_9PLEO|nr:unnamed protein product [Periconia digitata]